MDVFPAILCFGAAIAGLFLPGFLVARVCRIPTPAAAALPLSSLAICLTVILLQAGGLPLRFGGVVVVLLSVAAVCFLIEARDSWMRSAGSAPLVGGDATAGHPRLAATRATSGSLLIVIPLAISALLTLRVALEPLSGWDTPFRWDWLARCMLQHEKLDFYPPRTAADFHIYSYPDGLPPVVASVYWWLYASIGKAFPPLTAVAVAGQFLSLLGLVYAGGEACCGQRSGWVAVAVAASCPLVINGLAIGQETGFTAIAVAGQLVCGLAAIRSSAGGRQALCAGLFAALGCLARDYGPVLGLAGVAVLLSGKDRLRQLAVFTLAASPGLSWYVRNWWLTGNPVYSNPTPLDLPANPVLAGMLEQCRQSLALWNRPAADFVSLAGWLIMDAGLVLVAGLLAVMLFGRRLVAFWPTVATVIALWAWSVGFTAGGLWYSLRVLTPACAALAMVAPLPLRRLACVLQLRFGRRVRGVLMASLWIVCGGLGVLTAAFHPFGWVTVLGEGTLSTMLAAPFATRLDPLADQGPLSEVLRRLEQSSAPPCRILTDDLYLQVMLTHTNSRFGTLMVWSPEAAFLFDPDTGVEACRRQLAGKRVFLAMISEDFLFWQHLRQFQFFKTAAPSWQPFVGIENNPNITGIRVMPQVVGLD